MSLVTNPADMANAYVGTKKQAELTQNALDFQKQMYMEASNAYAHDIALGNEALDVLRNGIENGSFIGDASLFNAYQQYVAPEYEPGGQFENQDRSRLITPEKYQQISDYKAAVGPERFNMQITKDKPIYAAAAEYNAANSQFEKPDTYVPGTVKNTLQRPSAFYDKGESEFDQARQEYEAAAPIEYQQDFSGERAPDVLSRVYEPTEDRPDIHDPTKYEYDQEWKDSKYTGPEYMQNYKPYQGERAPTPERISREFETTLPDTGTGDRPDFYTAGDAPEANYYDPGEAYQRGEFSIENDPIYQQAVKEATRAVEASGAAKGQQLSGKTLKAIEENAVRLANQYGDQAYNRFNTEEDAKYQQYLDRQNQVKEAMNYKTEDEYRRYLNQNDIRGAEADKKVAQWENDRNVGIEQNKEAFLREQAQKQLGRDLNDDEFERWKATEGQKYQEFIDQRDWTTNQQAQNVDMAWQEYAFDKGMSRDVYESNRDYSTGQEDKYQKQVQDVYDRQNANYDTDYQNAYDAYQAYINQKNIAAQRSDTQYSEDLSQFNTNQDRSIAVQQQNIENTANAYDRNNQNFSEDRAYTAEEAQRMYENAFANYLQRNANYDTDAERRIALQQQNIENKSAANAAAMDQYNIDRGFEYGASQDKIANNLNEYQVLSGAYSQNLGDLLNILSSGNADQLAYQKLGADIYNQNYQNNLASKQANDATQLAYDTLKNDIYTTDQAFDYGVYNDQDTDAWNQYVYNNALRADEATGGYNLLTDQYNRDVATKNSIYQTLGDLLNVGSQSKMSLYGSGQAYTNNISDLTTGLGNVYAAGFANAPTSLL